MPVEAGFDRFPAERQQFMQPDNGIVEKSVDIARVFAEKLGRAGAE